MKIELYYFKLGLPKCVRIVSEKLQLDHTFCPAAGPIKILTVSDYMRLMREGVFTEVKILPGENEAYIRAPQPENRIYLNDWITLSDFSEVIEADL